ncbi:MAG: serine protein kinase PrkA [Polyangiaceae bacterium]|nr:serine protein kinase PrkA [Polyangiaceae bacterium]
MADSKDDVKNRRKLALLELDTIATALEQRFAASKTVLTFKEYLELFAENPNRHGRDAATYVRDMFDHYGVDTVDKPWGRMPRYKLFDLPWETSVQAREVPLVGQEELQSAVYKFLCNFVNEGRPNKLILMHGPNGSAKSTTAACVLRALEHYSTLEDGALYRFHWVFPSRKTTRGSIGFGETKTKTTLSATNMEESFAHLADDEIDARLVMEIRDHPLFLLPLAERRQFLDKIYEGTGERPPMWLVTGQLSHKNQQVFQALMMAEEGNLLRALRHVQIERWQISKKYRQGAITLGPELSVDAGERQVTADRSLSALPTALQATTLFEAHGELIEAAGGVLEFSDLLKRPIDAFRYLQLTLETGEVALPHQNVQTNVVMVGSANEIHLAAFREHPEFPSFRGRFELVAVPYLKSAVDERRIYDMQIVPYMSRHVAPHATTVAAEFAVMTRLAKPSADRYSPELGKILKELSVEQKMDLYSTGAIPESLDGDARKVLRAGLASIYRETESSVDYEGKDGASPRTMRTVLLLASQHPDYQSLSPFAVLATLDELCKQTSEYDWLRLKPQAGGYHDTKEMRTVVRRRLLDRIEEEMRRASGLVEELKYKELFDRYVNHVSVWVKGETIRNPLTGEYEKADERLMREVEGLLGIQTKNEDHRRGLISSIAAWAIDHPGEKVIYATVFPDVVRRLREAVFLERRKPVAHLVRDLARILRERKEHKPHKADKDLNEVRRHEAEQMMDRLTTMGYNEDSALDAASAVLRHRFAELV